MLHRKFMTEADEAELEEIERSVVDAKERRRRLMTRLRVRACRANKEQGK